VAHEQSPGTFQRRSATRECAIGKDTAMAETHHEHPDSSESRPTVEKFYIADVFTLAQRDRSLMQWPFMSCARNGVILAKGWWAHRNSRGRACIA
jgi:hypothetical protein